MKLQVLQDNFGNQTGVYVPMEDWTLIKNNYPDIETLEKELPQWQKDILDARLADLNNPAKMKSIEHLFDVLDEEI
jgi:hypothetical protein